MKITDFKQVQKKQVDEALSDFVGDYGSAAIKKLFGRTGGKTVQQQMAQDMYLKDFVGKALGSLDTAIQGGIVDPNLKDEPKAVSPSEVKPEQGQPGAEEPKTQPSPADTTPSTTAPTGTGLQKSSTAMAKGAYKQQQATTQSMNDYVKNVSAQLSQVKDKTQKVNLTKELVNFMADRKGYPEWENAIKTAEYVLKKSGDPNFATTAIQKLRQGQRMDLKPGGMAEAWQIYYLNKLVEGAGLTWKDLGLSVLAENRQYRIVESKYLKLNKIFEQIVTEAESIGQYLQKWFRQYMKGVDYSASQQDIDNLINNVQATYAKDKGKAALNKLANTAWALSQSSAGGQGAAAAPKAAGAAQPSAAGGEAPATEPAAGGAAPETSKAAEIQAKASGKPVPAAGDQSQQVKGAAQLVPQMNNYQLAELIKMSLDRLKKIDQSLYGQVVKSLSSGQAIPTQPPSSTPPGGGGAVTKESKTFKRK